VIGLRRGAVTAVLERAEALVRLEVDGIASVAYPRLTGPVAVGDEVLVNTQARELALGSGGFDVVVANLTRGLGLQAEPGAHVITLPYTPVQSAVRFAEETDELAERLDGMPVVLCTVHSQVVPVAAGLAGKRVAYVQVAGGALPVSLSDTVRVLKARGLVGVAVAAAPCLDGDVQCAGVAGALLWAARRCEAVIASVGPGLVGTGSPWGHGALALADVANVARALGGEPILAVRTSERDERERHRGISHHARAVLELSSPTVPDGGGEGWKEACAGLPLAHMGRGADEEPAFFAAAFSAGKLARDRLSD
jgi:hypothetical protein